MTAYIYIHLAAMSSGMDYVSLTMIWGYQAQKYYESWPYSTKPACSFGGKVSGVTLSGMVCRHN